MQRESSVVMVDKPLPSTAFGQRLSAASLPGYVSKLVTDGVASKKPSLVYFYTTATGPRGKGLTPQASACQTIDRTIFGGRDVRVGVLAKYFSCSKVNVTAVTPAKNSIFNTATAPVILVTTSSGKPVASLAGRVTSSALVAAMAKALQMSGINPAHALAKGEKCLEQIKKLENEKDKLTRAVARSTGSKQAQLSAKLDRVTKDLAAIEDIYKDLFK